MVVRVVSSSSGSLARCLSVCTRESPPAAEWMFARLYSIPMRSLSGKKDEGSDELCAAAVECCAVIGPPLLSSVRFSSASETNG